MDHAEVREILEIAAAEPGGFERLEAGDTPEAAAVASHLVDCRSCAAEWHRLAELSRRLRSALGTTHPRPMAVAEYKAPPELKSRTLRYVRELGKPVSPAVAELYEIEAEEPVEPPVARPHPVEPAPVSDEGSVISIDRRRRRLGGVGSRPALLRLVAIAAAVIIVAGLGTFAYAQQQQLTDARDANAVLYDLAEAQAAIAGQPDVKSVTLASSGGTSGGWILFSAGNDEMVMLARGLDKPAANHVYRCWVQTPAGKRVLGDALVAGGWAYWKGWPQSGLSDVKTGDTFGVSLVDTSTGAATVALTGTVN